MPGLFYYRRDHARAEGYFIIGETTPGLRAILL